MSAGTLNLQGADPLRPRPPGGMGRGALLALGVHALLVVALAVAVNWRSQTPQTFSAELWSATPQVAAPRAVESTPATPPPPPPPPPAPTPRVATPAPPPPVDPQIAIDKARQEKEKAERLRAEREQAERDAADLKGSDVVGSSDAASTDPIVDNAPRFGEGQSGDDADGDGTKKPSES